MGIVGKQSQGQVLPADPGWTPASSRRHKDLGGLRTGCLKGIGRSAAAKGRNSMSRVPIWRRYDRLLGPDRAADVKAELRFHIDAKTDDLIARGWPAEAARREAERQFGNI